MNETILRCPVCREELSDTAAGGLRCARGHSFDRAAKGYVNLLLTAKAAHGDGREMVDARRRFLGSGAYLPLAEAVSDVLGNGVRCVLDAGCGEGYYTELLASRRPETRFYGIDVSKDAIRAAAGRKGLSRPHASLFVAGVYDLPFADGAFDGLLSIFSPFAKEEFRRVLKRDGILVSAIPGARHLWGLKTVLYDTPYENQIADYAVDGFEFLGKREVQARILLKTPAEIKDLFAMTPYYYRTPEGGRRRLEALTELETEIAFEVLGYRRL